MGVWDYFKSRWKDPKRWIFIRWNTIVFLFLRELYYEILACEMGFLFLTKGTQYQNSWCYSVVCWFTQVHANVYQQHTRGCCGCHSFRIVGGAERSSWNIVRCRVLPSCIINRWVAIYNAFEGEKTMQRVWYINLFGIFTWKSCMKFGLVT